MRSRTGGEIQLAVLIRVKTLPADEAARCRSGMLTARGRCSCGRASVIGIVGLSAGQGRCRATRPRGSGSRSDRVGFSRASSSVVLRKADHELQSHVVLVVRSSMSHLGLRCARRSRQEIGGWSSWKCLRIYRDRAASRGAAELQKLERGSVRLSLLALGGERDEEHLGAQFRCSSVDPEAVLAAWRGSLLWLAADARPVACWYRNWTCSTAEGPKLNLSGQARMLTFGSAPPRYYSGPEHPGSATEALLIGTTPRASGEIRGRRVELDA